MKDSHDNDMELRIPIDTYLKSQLAYAYGVCIKTLKKWLLKHGITFAESNAKYFTPEQVRQIFEALDPPARMPSKSTIKKHKSE